MSQPVRTLETVRIANPCHVPWDEMTGDDRVRFCGQCQLNVYNLSAMTRREAEEFLRRREGRTCLRLFRRGDGTVLTRDCRTGRAAQERWSRAVRLLFGGWFLLLAVAMIALWGTELGTTKLGRQPDRWGVLRNRPAFRALLDWLDPLPPPPPPDDCIMGW